MIAVVPAENRFVTDTDWDGYHRFLQAVGQRRIRVTYDGTLVEIMAPSRRHEYLKKVLAVLLECLMDEREIDYEPGGNTTFKEHLKKKGLEPDECYWIASWREILGVWDAQQGPPPDLAIEVEVSLSLLDRLAIFADLGVPELWRVSQEGEVTIWVLQEGQYLASPRSCSFPDLPLALLNEHLAQAGDIATSRLVRCFRQALREST